MIKTERLVLIEGEFSNEEAREMLMNIFSSKMNFHQIKNFSSQIRFGKDDEIANKRISELKNEVIRLQEIITEAKTKNINLKIRSEISISLSEDT